MKSLKKILSSFLAIALMITMIQPGILATDTTDGTSENRATLKMVYLGLSSGTITTDTPSIQAVPDTSSWTADAASGTVFWLGLAISGVKSMDEATKGSHPVDKPSNAPAQGKSHFTEYANDDDYDWINGAGIYNIAAGIEYASEYIKPVYVSQAQLQSIMLRRIGDARYNQYSIETSTIDGTIFSEADKREPSTISSVDEPKLIYASITTTQVEPQYKIFGSQATLNDDDLIVFAAPFRLVKKPAAGTKIIQAALNPANFMIQTGDTSSQVIWSAQWNANRDATPEANLKNHFDYTGDLDLFPASASRRATTLTSTHSSYTLPAQLEGTALDVNKDISVDDNKLELTAAFTEAPNSVVLTAAGNEAEMSKVSYYYGDTGITDPSNAGLTPVPDKLTTDMTGKTLYAVYAFSASNKVMCSIGTLTVSARQLTTITLDTETVIDTDETTFGKTGTYYAGKEVINLLEDSTDQDIVVDLEYNNGDKVDNVHYNDFTTNGLALYYVDAAGKLQVVDATLTLKEDTNTFYVAATGNADKEPTAVTVKATLTVTGTKDKTNITSVTDSTPTSLSYKSTETVGEQPTLDFDDIEIATATDSGTTQSKKVSDYPDDTFIFFYVDDNTTPPTKYDDGDRNQHKVEADTKYTPQMNGKTLYVVPADDPTARPTEVGKLADRKLTSASSPQGDFTPDGTVYGDTLGSKSTGVKFQAVYDNGDTEEYDGFDNFPSDVKMRVVEPDTHDVVVGYEDIDETTVLKPDMDGKHLQFYMEGDPDDVVFNGTSGTTSGHITLHVDKKPVHVTLTAAAEPTSPTKTYDGNANFTSETTGIPTIGITTTDLIAADQTTVTGGATITGVTLAYSDKNAGNNKNIVITIADDAAVAGIADFTKNYTLVPDGTTMTTTGSTTVHNTIKGTINKKSITAHPHITGAPAAVLGKDDTLTGEGSYPMKAADGIVDGDVVWFDYTYKYNPSDVTSEKVGQNVDIQVTPKSPNPLSNGAGTAGDAANYDYTGATTEYTATGGGSVTNRTLNTISVTPTTQTYTYPDLTLNVADVQISYNYDGGTSESKTVADFLADNGAITMAAPSTGGTGAAITAANVSTFKFDAYGEWKLTFSKDGKTAELTITVKKKPIKLSDFTLTAEQKYNDANSQTTEAEFTGTGSSPIIDSDGDGTPDDVQITFDVEFTDPNAGENKDFTAKNLELTGDDADNYEIVDDTGAPITSSTTATGKGTITQGTQTAPGAVTLTKDNTDNSVDITGPVTEDGTIEYRYSTDGGSTWSDWSTDTTIENLPTNKNVTVQARVKETDDGNYAPSEAVEGTITTFKNHVTVYKVNSTTVLAEAYTDETTVTSDSGFNSSDGILGSKPSRFKAYYTDKEGKTKIEYPFTLKAETTLYMTQTSGGGGGGGGGGGSSVTVTFPESKLEGYVNDTLTLTPTITGTTNKPTWKSNNENIATVDENGNVKLLKEGEVRITASVGGVQKSVTITVKPEKQGDAVTPTPTPKPDEPLINTEYTKPYASGYDDGTFLPDNNITRAELASMIARLINGDDIPDGAYDSSFPDVPDNAWYNKYVGYLEAYDVISGYEDNTYRPENQVTRGELAAVITRAQKYDIISADGMFTDVTDADWAKDYITTLATLGIVSGYTNGTFAPYSPLTRAEAVTMINNVLAPSTAIMTFMPSDISGHWAEGNIILAVNEREVNGALETLVPEVDEAVPEETPAPEVDETATEAEETAPEDSETANEADEPAPEDGTTADPGSVTDPTE